METLRIDILNPKVKSLLKNLADLKLIRIKEETSEQELFYLLDDLRKNYNEVPSIDEIRNEVEEVRKARYESKKNNS